ncbi:unnamed protein product [Pleuronectes platessa]|uniref:Uncharacterized protein n=1 Tax=Pleuronectes platessa TaxID=8262 RepID=A0A9N7VVF0_PLEPL|nr:unnamed protein product [Pleuronectes platessa]
MGDLGWQWNTEARRSLWAERGGGEETNQRSRLWGHRRPHISEGQDSVSGGQPINAPGHLLEISPTPERDCRQCGSPTRQLVNWAHAGSAAVQRELGQTGLARFVSPQSPSERTDWPRPNNTVPPFTPGGRK